MHWLRDKTGKPYRLPTEAEREYAARAGTETAYWWGQDLGENNGNCGGGAGTAPVGSFPASPWGLYDTAGNVWEWVEDVYHARYEEDAPSDGSAWEGGDKTSRVLRGGSWGRNPRGCRAAFRLDGTPGGRFNGVGFRVCRAAPIE